VTPTINTELRNVVSGLPDLSDTQFVLGSTAARGLWVWGDSSDNVRIIVYVLKGEGIDCSRGQPQPSPPGHTTCYLDLRNF